MDRRERVARSSTIALGITLAALLTTGCKPEQLAKNAPRSAAADPAPRDDFPRQALVEHATRIAVSEAISSSNGPIPCSDTFEILDVRFGDKMEQGSYATATVNFTVRAKTSFRLTSWCFRKGGHGRDAYWEPGETQVIPREFQFQKWDSGWRLVG